MIPRELLQSSGLGSVTVCFLSVGLILSIFPYILGSVVYLSSQEKRAIFSNGLKTVP